MLFINSQKIEHNLKFNGATQPFVGGLVVSVEQVLFFKLFFSNKFIKDIYFHS